MSVASTLQKVQYTGNGATTVFPLGFRFLENSHIKAYLLPADASESTLLTLGTHYTLTGAGGSSGSLTMLTAPASGDVLTVLRQVPLTQDTHYPTQGNFSAQTVEATQDRIVMMIQQIQEQLDRSVTADVAAGASQSTAAFLAMVTQAEAAVTNAQQQVILANQAVGNAVTAANDSAASRDIALEAATDAALAAGSAGSWATNALTSATNAASSASSAANSATIAAASASSLQVTYFADTATAGQTAITHNLAVSTARPELVQVWKNGMRVANANYTLTSANVLTLATGAGAGDTIEVLAGAPLPAGAAMTAAVYDSNSDGIVNAADTATALSGLATADSGTFYGKNASGTGGFFTPTADDLPLLIPHVMPVVAQPTTGVALTKKKLNRLTAATAGTFYFPADLADGEWVAVRLAAGAGLHTLDCSNLSGVTFGLLDGTYATTAQTFAAGEYNAELLFRRDGNLIVKGV